MSTAVAIAIGVPSTEAASFPVPSFDASFPTASSLKSGLTYTRASQAWDYTLANYAVDAPRLTSSGLLYEEARTNKVVNNTTLTNAAGSGVAAIFTGSIADPFSGTDATRMAFDRDASDFIGRLALDTKPSGDVKVSFWARVQASSGDYAITLDSSDGSSEDIKGQLDGGAWVRVLSGALPVGAGGSGWIDFTDFTAGTTLDLDVFRVNVEETSGPASSPIVTAGTAVTRATGLLNVALADDDYDILIERATVAGVVTKAFADVTTSGGNGYDVPIDMTQPYLTRIRVWDDNELSAAQKTALTA